MAEKDSIDTNDLKTSESSSIEVLDLVDEVELVPDEKETVEPLEVLQEEVIDEEADEESGATDSDSTNDIEPLPILDGDELKSSSEETATENYSDTTGGDENGGPDKNDFDDDEFLGLDGEEFSEDPPEKKELPRKTAVESPEQDTSEKISRRRNSFCFEISLRCRTVSNECLPTGNM